MAGRPKKPAELKKAQGNRGKRKIQTEPEFKPGIPRMPAHLSPLAKTEWKRVAPILFEAGLLSESDRVQLEVYCEAYAYWRYWQKYCQEKDFLSVLVTPKGYKMIHPALAELKTAAKALESSLAQFGMSPATRSKVSPIKKKDEQSDFDRFRGSRASARELRSRGAKRGKLHSTARANSKA